LVAKGLGLRLMEVHNMGPTTSGSGPT
jgi:hypothetical protein